MDCYLCGAHNSADADFCERCNGQLLKIGLEPAPEVEEFVAPEPEIIEEPPPTNNAQVESLKSVEHRRLSAALGLGKPDTPPPAPQRPRPLDEPPEPSNGGVTGGVTGVPTAPSASGIPMIGTRAASVEASPIRDSDPGRKTAVALIVLAALVGWFGYRTLTSEPVDVPPDELAFATTTSLRPTTTTTEPPARQWTENEVLGKFSSVFVTVELYDCPAIETGKEEALDDWRTPGVLIDEHNVIFDGAELQGADIAVVRSRIGSETAGRLSTHGSGVGIVTSAAASNRNLKLVETPEGEPTFWVTRDPETNGIVVSTEPLASAGEAVVVVSGQGDPIAVHIGPRNTPLEVLQDIATQETTIVDDLSLGSSICAEAPSFVDAVVAATLVEEDD